MAASGAASRIPARISVPEDGGYSEYSLGLVAGWFYRIGSRTHARSDGMHHFGFGLTSWTEVQDFIRVAQAAGYGLGFREIRIEIAGIPEVLSVTGQ